MRRRKERRRDERGREERSRERRRREGEEKKEKEKKCDVEGSREIIGKHENNVRKRELEISTNLPARLLPGPWVEPHKDSTKIHE